MFKNFMGFWKTNDFLTKELRDFELMLTNSEKMFRIACQQLMTEESPGLKLRDELYEMDQEINAKQRKIRNRVLKHLTFQPTEDLPTALILMSVVKDAERLGDYCKNIFEVSDLLTAPFSKDYFSARFDKMDERLIELFQKTKKCFLESDISIAEDIINIEREILHSCDDHIKEIAKDNMETNLAVCTTLTYRYFKRVGAHLGNIATSVVMPISDLDYFDEKRRLGGKRS